jgi:cell division protease FtsH
VNSSAKTIMFWVFIAICLMMLWAIVRRSEDMSKDVEYSYSELYDKVQGGQVNDVSIQDHDLKGHLKVSPKDEFHTTLPPSYD